MNWKGCFCIDQFLQIESSEEEWRRITKKARKIAPHKIRRLLDSHSNRHIQTTLPVTFNLKDKHLVTNLIRERERERERCKGKEACTYMIKYQSMWLATVFQVVRVYPRKFVWCTQRHRSWKELVKQKWWATRKARQPNESGRQRPKSLDWVVLFPHSNIDGIAGLTVKFLVYHRYLFSTRVRL